MPNLDPFDSIERENRELKKLGIDPYQCNPSGKKLLTVIAIALVAFLLFRFLF